MTNPIRHAALLLTLMLAGCSMLGGRSAREFEPMPPEDLGPRVVANGAIYQSGYDVPLFENVTARRVGDIVTIRLVENTTASKNSTTSTKKSTNVDIPGPTIAGRPVTLNGTAILSGGVTNESQFDGEGTSALGNKMTGNIAVTIARRLSNGSLYVRGEKWITINQGREFVRVSGIIRALDVEPDNSIPSSKVANAVIAYSGRGPLNDANAPGWLARFFTSPKMPF